MNERYFFIAYSVRNKLISGHGNWGYITTNGSFFNRKEVSKSISEKINFEEKDIVIINFIEFGCKSDLEDFFGKEVEH